MKSIKLIILSIIFTQFVYSQTIINGNFENNTAGSGDQINLSNSASNAMLPDVNSFGSYGDVDIIKSSTYGGGGAQDKTWYLGITGGGTDIIAMSLTEPLVAGKTYSLSFYDRKHNAYKSNPIQIGISETNSAFGTVVFLAPNAPVENVWTQRTFTFTASHNEKFITVQMPTGDINVWANIDNFVLNPSKKCNDILVLSASTYIIIKGIAVTLTASGSANYTWTSTSALRNTSGAVISEIPLITTTYFVTSKVEGCSMLTASASISVIEPKKDSVIVKIILPKTDSVITKKEPLKFNRQKLNSRKCIIQETVNVPDAIVKLQVWDKNTVDGDMVSIYLNGQLLKDSVMVTNTKKEFILNLQAGKNLIVMEAINLGGIPPNTATIGINNRNKNITIVSDLKTSGAVELVFNPSELVVK